VTDLHCTTVGSGVPIVVLHGGMGLDHSYLRPWLDGLSTTAQVIYFDFRGNGRSPTPADSENLGPVEWCADIESVRTAFGHDKVVLLGHSVAGFLALEYARRHQDRVAGLILVGAAPVVDYGQDIFAAAATRGTPDQMSSLTTLFTAQSLDDEAYKRHYLSVLPLYFHAFDPGYCRHVASSVSFKARAFLQGRANMLTTTDARPWLPDIHVPSLVVCGDDDIFTPVEQAARRLARGLPNAELAVVGGTGHFPFVEAPDRFAAVVSSWLARRVQAQA
jgi:proline iminopeptidase